MPTYEFICHPKLGGCGHIIGIHCQFDDLEVPKRCEKCRKKKPLIRHYDYIASMPKTLGSLADKNSANFSNDYKQHIHDKNNAYKKKNPWVVTDDGIRHERTLKKKDK